MASGARCPDLDPIGGEEERGDRFPDPDWIGKGERERGSGGSGAVRVSGGVGVKAAGWAGQLWPVSASWAEWPRERGLCPFFVFTVLSSPFPYFLFYFISSFFYF